MKLLTIFIFALLKSFVQNQAAYDAKCKEIYGKDGGHITAETTFASDGCAYFCVKAGTKLNAKNPIKVDDHTTCDTNQICFNGYCLPYDSIDKCKTLLDIEYPQVVDLGCTIVCTHESTSETISKGDGEWCKSNRYIGYCNPYGECEGELRVRTTTTPAPTPAPDNYEVPIKDLCYKKFPYVDVEARAEPGSNGCKYTCHQGKKLLTETPLDADNMTPCGGTPDKACLSGICYLKQLILNCQKYARQREANGFQIELQQDPCNYMCHLYRDNQFYENTLLYTYANGTECGTNGQGQKQHCQNGYCRG